MDEIDGLAQAMGKLDGRAQAMGKIKRAGLKEAQAQATQWPAATPGQRPSMEASGGSGGPQAPQNFFNP